MAIDKMGVEVECFFEYDSSSRDRVLGGLRTGISSFSVHDDYSIRNPVHYGDADHPAGFVVGCECNLCEHIDYDCDCDVCKNFVRRIINDRLSWHCCEMVSNPVRRISYLKNNLEVLYASAGFGFNGSCGFHVHVSFDSVFDYERLMSWEFVSDYQSAVKRDDCPVKNLFRWSVDRTHTRNYYEPYSGYEDLRNNLGMAFVDCVRESRYKSVNFFAYNVHKTVEFRSWKVPSSAEEAFGVVVWLKKFIDGWLASHELASTEVEEFVVVEESPKTPETIVSGGLFGSEIPEEFVLSEKSKRACDKLLFGMAGLSAYCLDCGFSHERRMALEFDRKSPSAIFDESKSRMRKLLKDYDVLDNHDDFIDDLCIITESVNDFRGSSSICESSMLCCARQGVIAAIVEGGAGVLCKVLSSDELKKIFFRSLNDFSVSIRLEEGGFGIGISDVAVMISSELRARDVPNSEVGDTCYCQECTAARLIERTSIVTGDGAGRPASCSDFDFSSLASLYCPGEAEEDGEDDD